MAGIQNSGLGNLHFTGYMNITLFILSSIQEKFYLPNNCAMYLCGLVCVDVKGEVVYF